MVAFTVLRAIDLPRRQYEPEVVTDMGDGFSGLVYPEDPEVDDEVREVVMEVSVEALSKHGHQGDNSPQT
jgi:hypothetical protein